MTKNEAQIIREEIHLQIDKKQNSETRRQE